MPLGCIIVWWCVHHVETWKLKKKFEKWFVTHNGQKCKQIVAFVVAAKQNVFLFPWLRCVHVAFLYVFAVVVLSGPKRMDICTVVSHFLVSCDNVPDVGLMVFRPIAPLPCTNGISCCVIAMLFSNNKSLSHHGNICMYAMAPTHRCNTPTTLKQQ